ncbi:hypothetical protein [Salipiger abyssi]|uniref:hypothetical protein n=1 Tax=Salipiger abyssi TaxID=1250539 RepID=UPI004058A7A0
MAVARAQPAPAGEIVICSGLGLVTVMVDAEGNPVGHSHVCPDGLLTLFAAAGGGWTPPQALPLWLRVAPEFAARRGQGMRMPVPQARDPPAAV